jgi:hypothetical protein
MRTIHLSTSQTGILKLGTAVIDQFRNGARLLQAAEKVFLKDISDEKPTASG